jgi:hypothetical protein
VERAALAAKLDRVLAMRVDLQKGLASETWAETLDGVDRDLLLRAAIAVVRELVVQEWADRRRDDKRPQRALEAAEAWLAAPTPDAVAHAKALAKDCTAARNETFGTLHRFVEAARAVAWTVGAKDSAHVFEALTVVEEELLARVSLTSEYHLAPEQRKAVVAVLRRVLLPPEKTEAAAPAVPRDGPPVPYSADAHFEVGQKLSHKKFGELAVTGAGETWIEVELPDGTKKRLAHKP